MRDVERVAIENRKTCEREQIGDADAVDEAEAINDTDAIDQLIGAGELVPALDNKHVAFASAGARNGLHDGLEVGEVEWDRMVVRLERICRIGDPAHREARAGGGAHAGDDEIVEPPGLDGNILVAVAEHRQADAVHREALADMGNDADAGAVLGGGVRFRRLRFLRSGLGRQRLWLAKAARLGRRSLDRRRVGRGSWRRLRQSRLRQRQRKPQGDIADHVSLRCEHQIAPAKLQPRIGAGQ